MYRGESGERVLTEEEKKAECIFENRTKEQKLGACLGVGRGHGDWVAKAVKKHTCKGLRIKENGDLENYKLLIMEWAV